MTHFGFTIMYKNHFKTKSELETSMTKVTENTRAARQLKVKLGYGKKSCYY